MTRFSFCAKRIYQLQLEIFNSDCNAVERLTDHAAIVCDDVCNQPLFTFDKQQRIDSIACDLRVEGGNPRMCHHRRATSSRLLQLYLIYYNYNIHFNNSGEYVEQYSCLIMFFFSFVNI